MYVYISNSRCMECLELQRGQVRKIDGKNEKVRKRKVGYVNKNTCKTIQTIEIDNMGPCGK